jgi:hypothetical protein
MPSDSEHEDDKGFKVDDRRRFSPDTGETRENKEDVAPPEEQIERASVQQPVDEKTRVEDPLPPINWASALRP